jgi:hypothetical protein
VHGRLKWSDIEASAGVRPEGTPPDALVEWNVKMPPARSSALGVPPIVSQKSIKNGSSGRSARRLQVVP